MTTTTITTAGRLRRTSENESESENGNGNGREEETKANIATTLLPAQRLPLGTTAASGKRRPTASLSPPPHTRKHRQRL
jgi:hypothetical protein